MSPKLGEWMLEEGGGTEGGRILWNLVRQTFPNGKWGGGSQSVELA